MTTQATRDLVSTAIQTRDGQHDATVQEGGCICPVCADPWLLACACGHPHGQHAANDGPCTDFWHQGAHLVPCECPGFAPTGETLEATPTH